MNVTIELENGSTKNVLISKMGAMQGWDMQRRFIEFAMSKDSDFRTQYTLEVLSFAKIDMGSSEPLPLSTGALIDNHLQSWKNIQKVFEAVLRHNGIDPNTHAEKPHYWALAGAEMATAFLGSVIELVGPMMQNQPSKKE